MKEKLYEIFNEICPFEEIEDDTLLLEMGVLDSLAIFSLMEKIEEQMDIIIKEEDILPENFASVEAICHMLEGYK